jgi:cyclopropane-fatty-acyl-phospholipid synthase
MSLTSFLINQMERGRVPDAITRAGIRHLCQRRLRNETQRAAGLAQEPAAAFAALMNSEPVAPVPEKANEQHYEVPAEFFALVLGEHRKYSGCSWAQGTNDLDTAEAASLAQVCERAELRDGMDILELGCGWGSLTLWMAARYPNAAITAVSNSASQRQSIMQRAEERGLYNVQVITADMNEFAIDRQFDRVVSVEMFEHMRNHRELLSRVAGWLRPEGRLFIHIFCHRTLPYAFEGLNDADWMSQHFFTGGIMPSFDLLHQYDENFTVVQDWWLAGTHYQKTAEAWLRKIDANRDEVQRILADVYGEADAARWYHRWRIFFMACAELFGLRDGAEWGIGHYLLEPVHTARSDDASSVPSRPQAKPQRVLS